MSHSPHHNEEHHPQSHRLSLLKSPLINVKPVVPTYDPSQNYSQTGSWVPGGINDGAMHETPQFQRHEEATTIELFYDLFFVANLTTFTSLHKINEPSALRSYSGFFCLLWFTWCQVSLFDVRFVADSILERIAKACQFGVMIGLAGKLVLTRLALELTMCFKLSVPSSTQQTNTTRLSKHSPSFLDSPDLCCRFSTWLFSSTFEISRNPRPRWASFHSYTSSPPSSTFAPSLDSSRMHPQSRTSTSLGILLLSLRQL